MSELTRIATVEITLIGQADMMPEKEAAGKQLEEVIKKALNADDAKVIKVQDFVMDKDNQTGKEAQTEGGEAADGE